MQTKIPESPLTIRSQERQMLYQMVARFTKEYIVPNIEGWEDQGEVPRSLHKKAAELGILSVGFPQNVGGIGNIIDSMIVSEAIIQSGGSSGICAALLTLGIAIPHIIASNDQYLIEKYAKPTMSGDLIGSLAITEPNAGSDVAAITTSATRDGDRFLINGAKTYITSGYRADFVVVALKTSPTLGHKGISLVVVEKGTEGFNVTRKLEKLGWHCSDTAELSFSNVIVTSKNLIGEEGSGFSAIMANFATERLSMASQALASAKRCIDLTMTWVQNRKVFGTELSKMQLTRQKLAEMQRQYTVARTFLYDTAIRYVNGEKVIMEVAMAKNTAVYAMDAIINQALQLHGGMGYMRENEIERHYRDGRIMGIGGGTNEIMNEIIAKQLQI